MTPVRAEDPPLPNCQIELLDWIRNKTPPNWDGGFLKWLHLNHTTIVIENVSFEISLFEPDDNIDVIPTEN
jgi:hypothetical protein